MPPSKLGGSLCLAAVNVFGRNLDARQLGGIFQTSDLKKAATWLSFSGIRDAALQTPPNSAQYKKSVMI